MGVFAPGPPSEGKHLRHILDISDWVRAAAGWLAHRRVSDWIRQGECTELQPTDINHMEP